MRWITPAIGGLVVGLALTPASANEIHRGQPDQLIAPSVAFSSSGYGSATTHTRGDCEQNCSALTDHAPEIVELARALRYDPDLIFEWVHDNIRLAPTFGMQKGALGALIDGEGTAFDQVQLALDLLEEADAHASQSISATIQIGTLSLNGTEFGDWFGLTNARAACQFLAAGGFPGRVNNSTNCSALSGSVSSVDIGHVQLNVSVGGASEVWDPAYKTHIVHSGIDFDSAIGASSGSTLSQIQSGMSSGSQSGIPYISNLNQNGLNATLASRTATLENEVQTNHEDASLRELLGGMEIEPLYNTGLADYLTVAAKAPAGAVTAYASGLSAVPDQYRTALSLSTQMIGASLHPEYEDYIFGSTPIELYSDEIYGNPIFLRTGGIGQVTGASSSAYEFNVSLMVNGQAIYSHSDQDTATVADDRPPESNLRTFDTTLTVNHPYLEDAGGYMDVSASQPVVLIEDAVLVAGFGRASPRLLSRWNDLMGPERLAPVLLEDSTPWDESSSGEPQGVRSENLRHQLAGTWLSQFSRMMELQAGVGQSRAQHHHSIGFVSADTVMSKTRTGQGTGERPENWTVDGQANVMNFSSAVSVTHRAANVVRGDAVSRAIAAAGSALEGSAIEQLQDTPFSASVAGRFAWGNAPAGSHQLTEDTAINDYDYSGPYRYYLFDSVADVSQLSSLITFDGVAAAPTHHYGGFRGNLIDTITAYLNNGYVIYASQEAFAGPGGRCGVKITSYVEGFEGQQSSYTCWGGYDRGGAFVAMHPSTGEVRYILTSRMSAGGVEVTGGSGSVGHPEEIASHSAPTAADLLAEQEDLSWSHNVDLQTGQLTFAPGPVLSVGAGDFPYSLSFERTYESGRHAPGHSPWQHNWDFELSVSGSGMEAMGLSNRENAYASLVAFAAMQDVFLNTGSGSTALAREIGSMFVAHWWMQQMRANVVSLQLGGETQQFVRRVDGGFNPPALSLASLSQTGQREIVQSGEYSYEWRSGGSAVSNPVSFVYTDESGNTVDFEYVGGNDEVEVNGQTVLPFKKAYRETWRADTWTFQRGITVDFEYATGCGAQAGWYCNELTRVSNSLGFGLNIIGDDEKTGPTGVAEYNVSSPRSVSFSDEVVSSTSGLSPNYVDRFDTVVEASDGAHTRYVIERFQTGAIAEHYGSFLTEVYLPEDLNTDGSIGSDNPSYRFAYDDLGRVETFSYRNSASAYADYEYFLAAGGRAELLNPLDDPANDNGDVTYYDADGRAYRTITHEGRETWSGFDGLGRMTEQRQRRSDWIGDRYDSRSVYAYDSNHNRIRETRYARTDASGTPLSGDTIVTRSEYNEPGYPRLVTRQIDARNNATTYDYDAQGRLIEEAGPEGELTEIEYDSRGLPTAIVTRVSTAPLVERRTEIDYDSVTGLPEVRRTVAPSAGDNIEIQFDWTEHGEIERITDDRGNVTEADYDDAGRVTDVVSALGSPDVSRVHYEYDDNGRVTEIRNATNTAGTAWATTAIAYHHNGRAASVTDPQNDVTSFDYDLLRRLSEVTDGQGRVTGYDYSPDGQQDSGVEALGTSEEVRTHLAGFDTLGQRISLRQANGLGENPGVDADNARFDTLWTYDPFGRLDEVEFPAPVTGAVAPSESFGHDDNGNVTSHTTRAGDVITMVYDDSNRLTHKTTPEGTTVTTYNQAGEPVSVTRPDPHTTGDWQLDYAYDFAGRQIGETQTTPENASRTVSYRYDGAGNRTHIIWPDGYTARYVYDDANRVSEIWVANGPDVTGWRLAEYDYDPQGRLVAYRTRRGPGGTLFSEQTFVYEVDSDLATLEHDFYSTIPDDVTYTYGYDDAGYLTSQAADNATWRWSPATSSVGYQTASYEANRLDQYAAVSGTSYSYDLNGNLLSDGLRSFTYSAENQLLTATTLSGGLAAYSYGPAARRVRKTVDGVGTDYLHAGSTEIAEYDSVSGELLRRYIPGPGVDQRVVMVDCGTSANCRAREAGTQTDYYHADRQGNVLAVTRAGADALVQQFFYTPFGVELVGDASGNPFRYTGRRFDPETGLYYYRARYYDPNLGRFLQVDPIGYEDQWNLYAYVGNNPLNATDPSGMRPDDGGAAMVSAQKQQLIFDQLMLDWQLSGEYRGSREESGYYAMALAGGARWGYSAWQAWSTGSAEVAWSLAVASYEGMAIGGATGCGSAALDGQSCANGALIGALTGGLTSKVGQTAMIAMNGARGARAVFPVAAGIGGVTGAELAGPLSQSDSATAPNGQILPGESVEINIPGPFSTITATNNGDGTVTYTGSMSRADSRITREVTRTVCVRDDGCK